MVVLVVDDQTNVVAGIVSGVRWEKLQITKVWTAYNAYEAREILKNHPVDILLCDIEMPFEDGLSLLRWIKSNDIPVLCIFLTAHADFMYAKEAVRLGGFDYILQPARYEDIEKSIQRAQQAILKKHAQDEYSAYGQLFYRKKERLLDSVLQDWLKTSSPAEALNVYDDLTALNIPLDGKTPVHIAAVRIGPFQEGVEAWPAPLIRYALENMLTELFEHYGQTTLLSGWDASTLILLVMSKHGDLIDKEGAARQLTHLQGICQTKLRFQLAFRMEDTVPAAGIPARAARLAAAVNQDAGIRESGRRAAAIAVPLSASSADGSFENAAQEGADQKAIVIKVAEYIQNNIEQDIRREDIAAEMFFSKTYISRLFKRETGVTLKEYIVTAKMQKARELLKATRLPVGVVAAKVGYDNFSHFTQVYKHVYGITPTEERK